MKKSIIGLILVLFIFPLSCYAVAGFFERYLEMVDVLDAILRIIFVSQIAVFLLLRLKRSKRIRLRILLWTRRLHKNNWVNLYVAWALSSFVLTSYLYVFCFSLWILAIIPFFLFGVIYWVIVLRKKLRVKCLSGLKAIYFYLITSIGQIIGLCIYYVAYILKWYIPYDEYTGILWDFLGYKTYIGKEGGCVLLNGMLELAIYMAIPYLLLMAFTITRMLIDKMKNSLRKPCEDLEIQN